MMKDNVKGNISLETVVGAIIVVIVLVVIVGIFINQTSDSKDNLRSCALTGGKCVAQGSCSGITIKGQCPNEQTQICCSQPFDES